MKKISLLALSFCSLFSYNLKSSEKHFNKLKAQIDFHENSVIQEFSFTLPESPRKALKTKDQIRMGNLLEKKFLQQKKMFYSAQEALFEIEKSIPTKVKIGLLSSSEADRLITSVEYARRIILQPREVEVQNRYNEFRKKLTQKPSLDDLYNKLSHNKLPGQCYISDLGLNQDKNQLSFKINQKDSSGNIIYNEYFIKEENINEGLMTSHYQKGSGKYSTDKIIFNFNNVKADQSSSRFSLYIDRNGDFIHAEFTHDKLKSQFLTFFGLLDFGKPFTKNEIICSKSGHKPASIILQSAN